MARKHFDEYYESVCKQFFQLNDVFEDLAKEVQAGMVEPERQKELEKTIQPIRNSYQTLSYIKYLLDKPTRKEKEAKFKKLNKKLLEQTKGYQDTDVINANNDILSTLKK